MTSFLNFAEPVTLVRSPMLTKVDEAWVIPSPSRGEGGSRSEPGEGLSVTWFTISSIHPVSHCPPPPAASPRAPPSPLQGEGSGGQYHRFYARQQRAAGGRGDLAGREVLRHPRDRGDVLGR